jgi:hypothetical protein
VKHYHHLLLLSLSLSLCIGLSENTTKHYYYKRDRERERESYSSLDSVFSQRTRKRATLLGASSPNFRPPAHLPSPTMNTIEYCCAASGERRERELVVHY